MSSNGMFCGISLTDTRGLQFGLNTDRYRESIDGIKHRGGATKGKTTWSLKTIKIKQTLRLLWTKASESHSAVKQWSFQWSTRC